MTGRPPRLATLGEAIVAFMRHPSSPEGYLGPFASGAPCIFASAAARLGVSTRLGAGWGRDDFGTVMASTLGGHGVVLDHVHVADERPTSSAFVRYRDDGSRSFIFYLEATAALDFPEAGVDALLAGVDWLHVSGSTIAFGGQTGAAAELALDAARARGVRTSVDPNVRPEAFTSELGRSLRRHIAAADVVFASEGELDALGLNARHVASKGALVVAKQGARGASVLIDDRWVTVPAIEVDQVDPDGAGDVFAAAFVSGTLAGRDPVAAAELGCQVAGESVAVHGPMNSSITRLPELGADS